MNATDSFIRIQMKMIMFLLFTEEFSLPSVTVDYLKEDKGYGKAAKKYIKEYEGLQKKQNKERNSVISNQCKTMEKLANKKKLV